MPPPEDERYLREIRAKGAELSKVMQEIITVAPERVPRSLRIRAERMAVDLNQLATELANQTSARTDAVIAQNASAYTGSRNLFIGVAAGAIVLALLLGFVLSWSVDRADPADRRPAGRDRLRELLGARGHHQPGRARRARGQREPDERRAPARVYKELETASEHKSEFLASMSHELRTPLNAIIGFSQVLRERISGDINAKQEEYLDDILSSANHLLALINEVLDLAKVEAGQVELHVAPFSLEDALERGISMVRGQATSGGVQVTLHANGGPKIVTGDERRIRQVIFNLLSNAVKFTPSGGRVDVTATHADGEARISVADTGGGIAADDLERIFEEFQQTEVGARLQEGTGLGLALSKRFVEMHGGRIWCDSVVGTGSTFVFTLPLGEVER